MPVQDRNELMTGLADVADTSLRDDESVRRRHERATREEDREQMQTSKAARTKVDRAIEFQKEMVGKRKAMNELPERIEPMEKLPRENFKRYKPVRSMFARKGGR